MSTVESLSPWSKSPQPEDALERRLSRLFGAVPEPEALPEFSRQRVGVRLRTRGSRGGGLMLVRLVALGAVIGITGAAAAQWAAVHLFGAQQEFATHSVRVVRGTPPRAPKPLPRRGASEPLPLVEEPVVTPPEAPAAVVVAPAAPAPAQSSRLGLEAASLEAALKALHGGGALSAQRGLKAIDQHLHDFPGGALELEARVARVDALLVLGRRQEARRELSALPIENVGRKNELRLIRAELRADDDCRAALSDFQVLIDLPLAAGWAERALFGRGACLLKLGDQAGAQRDFDRYLERFPNGRFAEQIRAQKK
ncbi:MAG TPA: tetratricopeptide repeat protein [Polyangiaceae bacterium]|nr:tetratricopeptide repeat protein [Polyangiaceae bacterium]